MVWYDLSRENGIIEHARPPVVDHHEGEMGHIGIGEVVHIIPIEEQQQRRLQQAEQPAIDKTLQE